VSPRDPAVLPTGSAGRRVGHLVGRQEGRRPAPASLHRRRLVLEDPPPDPLGDLWDEGVAEGGTAVHPIGNPINHSTHSGFSRPPGVLLPARLWTVPESVCLPLLDPGTEEYPLRASEAVGVGQVSAMCSSVFWTTRPVFLS
jgi:hypothetical protein